MSEEAIFHRAYPYRPRGCRTAWNLALAEQEARRERGEKYAGYVTMAKWFTEWRNAPETAYLAEVPVHVLQNVARALDEAFKASFAEARGYPKFNRRGDPIGLRDTDVKAVAVDAANWRIRSPQGGLVALPGEPAFEGRPITVTLRVESDGWYVSIACAFDPKALERGSKACGIDRGVTNLAAFDNGCRIAPLEAHKHVAQRLRRYQRAVARKIEAAKVVTGIPKGKPFPKGPTAALSAEQRRTSSACRSPQPGCKWEIHR
jgi:putative transposase